MTTSDRPEERSGKASEFDQTSVPSPRFPRAPNPRDPSARPEMVAPGEFGGESEEDAAARDDVLFNRPGEQRYTDAEIEAAKLHHDQARQQTEAIRGTVPTGGVRASEEAKADETAQTDQAPEPAVDTSGVETVPAGTYTKLPPAGDQPDESARPLEDKETGMNPPEGGSGVTPARAPGPAGKKGDSGAVEPPATAPEPPPASQP